MQSQTYATHYKCIVQGQFRVIRCISSFDDLVSTFDLNIQGCLYCQVYTLLVFLQLQSKQNNYIFTKYIEIHRYKIYVIQL